jgi:hypothetical protein
MRDPDVAQWTTAELQAVRRDLAVSLGLASPCSPAGTVIGVQIAAIDAELSKRPDASLAQVGNAGGAEILPAARVAAAVDAPATDST